MHAGNRKLRRFALCALRFALAVLLCSIGCRRQEPAAAASAVAPAVAAETSAPAVTRREPAVAGGFYPADPQKLRATVEEYLAAAQPAEFKGRILALVAPHAGYMFSGKVAGWSFKQLRKGAFERVILLGPSHYGAFRGFSILDVDAFATPLGDVPLDRDVCAKLRAHELHARVDPLLHYKEHSIEVELPFLQVALGEFKLVPILVGGLAAGDAEKIAAALREYLTPSTLVVASSDFTHYGPNYRYLPFTRDVEQNLKKLDMGAVNLILKKDYDGYAAYMENPGPTICGRYPLAILLKLLPAEAEGRLLKYDTSGRVTGDFTNSVSYVSLIFTVPAAWKPPAAPAPQGGALTAEERKVLLKIARDTLEAYVRTGRAPEIAADKYPLTPALKAEAGAFVTLNEKHQLRGCIGRIGYSGALGRALPPLYQTVAMMAVEAAAHDPRFGPVRPEELKDITIEVSVLSLAQEVRGPEDFQVGRQGIIIRKGSSSAVFLPQVAPEQGWTREQTLDNLCLKGGMPPDEWRKPGMTFLTFTAQVFGE